MISMLINIPKRLFAILFILVLSLVASPSMAASDPSGLWKEGVQNLPPGQQKSTKVKRHPEKFPRKYRMLELNVKALEALLKRAPDENSRRGNKGVEITLPNAEGEFQAFSLFETTIMQPGLAQKFPEIRTFIGTGIENETIGIRVTWSPRGIEIIVLGTGESYFIEPFEPGSNSPNYIAYKGKDLPQIQWDENLPPLLTTAADTFDSSDPVIAADVSSGTNWRIYDLAITTSQEYYTNNGGTDPLVMSSIVNRVNQLNAIYERELAVRFVLVSDNDKLLDQPYSDAGGNISCPGYPSLGNVTNNINLLIAPSSYDVGHLFLWGYNGGVAYRPVVCHSRCKADGQSGVNAAIDIVAHEIGHMFSMEHTWNKCGGVPNGNRSPNSAFEPGSGNTLMSYNGSCGTDNLQGDLFQFHVRSYDQAESFIGGNGSCFTGQPSANSPPQVDAGTSFITIPASTPFVLEGSAFDVDGDALSYSWEGYNLGPETTAGTGDAPFFRVFEPAESPARYFPPLDDIVNGTTTPGIELPSTSQNLEFRLHVYDGRGGVSFDEPNTLVDVDGSTGPFRVTSPNNSSVSWIPGDSQNVTWNVAGTDSGNVNCANVAIDLSVDGGYNYTVPLSLSTPNDGSHSIVVPEVLSAAARARVRCADYPDHFFFDISDADFVVDHTPGSGECSGGASVEVNSLDDVTANDNACTLREATVAVNSGGFITFDQALINGIITLGSEINVTNKSMTIVGGDRNLTISGSDNNRIFYFDWGGNSSRSIKLTDLTLTRGFTTGTGGAIRNDAVTLELQNVTISDSEADHGGALHHSGASWAVLTIEDSTFVGNRADFIGGAFRLSGNSGAQTTINGSTFYNNEAWRYGNSVGGAIATLDHNLRVTNSTFNNNRSLGTGGGIGDYSNSGTVFTIRNSTLYNNFADDSTNGTGAGSNLYHVSASGSFNLVNSILGGDIGDDCHTVTTPATNINNLIEDGSCSPSATGDPMLGTLTDNGGPTRTMAPFAGSPALGAGSTPNCETFDQRGYTRKAPCDIGAFESISCGNNSYSVPQDQWHQIALPCDPGANNTVNDILSDDLAGVYGSDWGMYSFDESTTPSGSYTWLSPGSVMEPGRGYWLLHFGASQNWSMDPGDDINQEPFDIPLTPAHDGETGQQNMLGNPTKRTISWGDTVVLDSFDNCYGSPSLASQVGTTGLISKTINQYNGNGYTPCDDTGANGSCSITAGDGFWLKVPDNGETNLRLRIGGSCQAGSGSAMSNAPSADSSNDPVMPAGWAVSLTVNSGPYEDPINTLGLRENALHGYDRSDLKELPPDRYPFMTLVFPHSDWGENSGDYATDYLPLDNTTSNEWYFVIRTSEALEELTITWQADENVLKRSKLEDLDTGKIYNLKKTWSHTTEWMGLQERRFKWTVKKSKK